LWHASAGWSPVPIQCRGGRAFQRHWFLNFVYGFGLSVISKRSAFGGATFAEAGAGADNVVGVVLARSFLGCGNRGKGQQPDRSDAEFHERSSPK
jgi:hypothetical protein